MTSPIYTYVIYDRPTGSNGRDNFICGPWPRSIFVVEQSSLAPYLNRIENKDFNLPLPNLRIYDMLNDVDRLFAAGDMDKLLTFGTMY